MRHPSSDVIRCKTLFLTRPTTELYLGHLIKKKHGLAVQKYKKNDKNSYRLMIDFVFKFR